MSALASLAFTLLTSLAVLGFPTLAGSADAIDASGPDEVDSSLLEGAAEASAATLRLNEALLDAASRSAELGQAGREGVIGPVAIEIFDLPWVARASLGNYFDALDADQQELWTEVYIDFHIAAVAYNWRSDRESRFRYLGVDQAPRKTLLVKTLLDRTGQGADVRRDYRFARVRGRWRIIDVYTPGAISQVGMRRSEYLAVLVRSSFDDLVAHMQRITASRRGD